MIKTITVALGSTRITVANTASVWYTKINLLLCRECRPQLGEQVKKERDYMSRFIPYNKMSKKAKREQDRSRRDTWTINPVTRKPPNPKAYKRTEIARNEKKSRQGDDGFLDGIFPAYL